MSRKLIAEYRAEIDMVDTQLLCLLNHRAELARRLGPLKQLAGMPLCDRNREARVLARLNRMNPGPLDPESVTRVFRVIIRESRRLQKAPPRSLAGKLKRPASQGERHDRQHA